jgi:integrase
MSRGRPRLPIGTAGEISTKQLANGNYVSSCIFRRADGKNSRLSRSGVTKAASIRAIRVAIRDAEEDTRGHSGELQPNSTVEFLVNFWLEDFILKKNPPYGTLTLYRGAIRRDIIPNIGGLRLRELTVPALDRFFKELAKRGPSVAITPRTVLNNALNLAVKHEAVFDNPIRRLGPLPVQEKKEVKAIDDEHVERIFSALPKYRTSGSFYGPRAKGRFKDMLIVMFGSGVRIGELLGLKVGDINLESVPPTLSVNGTVVHVTGMGSIYQPKPKTKSSIRTLPISQDAAEAVKRQIEGRDNLGPDDFLFVTYNNTIISDSNFAREWRNFLAHVGLTEEKINTHRIRKTYATRIEKTVGIHSTSKLLGHSSIATTLRSYIATPNVINPGVAEAIQEMYSKESNLLAGAAPDDLLHSGDYVI